MAGDQGDGAAEFLVAAPVQLDEVPSVLDEAAGPGDVTVAGSPGQRLDEGPVTMVSRYERRLAATP